MNMEHESEIEKQLDEMLDNKMIKFWVYFTIIPATIIAYPLSFIIYTFKYALNIAEVMETWIERKVK